VEHAPPAAIRAALSSPRPSDPQRREFDRDQLIRWGLANELHARVSGMGGMAARWAALCPLMPR
jgi:hypothetical protein